MNTYLAQIKPGTMRLSSPFPAPVLMELGTAIKQTGRYRELMGDDERLTLNHGLRTAEKLPPIWIMQGIDDSRVSLTLSGQRYGYGGRLNFCLAGA